MSERGQQANAPTRETTVSRTPPPNMAASAMPETRQARHRTWVRRSAQRDLEEKKAEGRVMNVCRVKEGEGVGKIGDGGGVSGASDREE